MKGKEEVSKLVNLTKQKKDKYSCLDLINQYPNLQQKMKRR